MEQTKILTRFFANLALKPEAVLLIAFAMLIFLCILCIFIGRHIGKLEMRSNIKKQRQDAVKRSKSVVTGQVYEQIAPLLPNFPCNINDVQFIGKPIDFIGFCGNNENGLVEEIVFIEVKSGSSNLSPRERSVKEAVQKGKIRYVEYRI